MCPEKMGWQKLLYSDYRHNGNSLFARKMESFVEDLLRMAFSVVFFWLWQMFTRGLESPSSSYSKRGKGG